MPCELIERMAACDDCRILAVDYDMNMISSLGFNAAPHDWGLPLTTSRIHLDDHLRGASTTPSARSTTPNPCSRDLTASGGSESSRRNGA